MMTFITNFYIFASDTETTEVTNAIFDIKNEAEFIDISLDTFRFQYSSCRPYRDYVDLTGTDPDSVTTLADIPFAPISLFRTHRMSTSSVDEIVFTSSGTTSGLQSRHHVASASMYRESFTRAFELFYGKPEQCNIYALLPSYLERDGSSLIYMVTELIKRSHDGGFFLYNHDELVERLNRRDRSRPTILFGVGFALLDLAESRRLDLSEVIVMETGGMKGRRREITRSQLHATLQERLGVTKIHSEYGMCELLSQAYSAGEGIFFAPPWMRILIRDENAPFVYRREGMPGGINVIDLANRYSCSFLQTDDLGRMLPGGGFTVEGRIEGSMLRGCNLLLDELEAKKGGDTAPAKEAKL